MDFNNHFFGRLLTVLIWLIEKAFGIAAETTAPAVPVKFYSLEQAEQTI